MDLGETGVRETSASLVGPPDGSGVGHSRIGREEEDIRISARRKDHGIAGDRFDLAVDHVADHDPARLSVNDNEIEHFPAGIENDISHSDLP